MRSTIGMRLRAAREQAGLTQQHLSAQLGFKDRQTLAAIESGGRKVSADELLMMMRVLGRELEYFTDPFRIDGEGAFSWRTYVEKVENIDVFELWASRCLALYRSLATQEHVWTSPLRLGLTTRSSYEDAHRAAEWLVNEWDLGDIPAACLEEAVSQRLRALVLYIDPPEGISGAAFRLPELSAILINRSEPPGRRSFDLAHELFHLLTWDTIRPNHSENRDDSGGTRPEQLANCFASALLMPEGVVRSWWEQAPKNDHTEWRPWVIESAKRFRVTPSALLWRFVQLDMTDKSTIEDSNHWSAMHEGAGEKPRRFSLDFMRALKCGLEEGRISVRRAAGLVGLSVDDLADLFLEHSLEVPFDI